MFELERFDQETGISVEPPFYLLRDSAMINSLVFRSPEDYQYTVLSAHTFEGCKSKIITREDIESKRLIAQLDHFPYALDWHGQYVDKLWTVCKVQSFENWYKNSDWIGFLDGGSVSRELPKTYAQFKSKRDELRKAQEEFERHINSLRFYFKFKLS